jgi:Plasmid pRiA4b ORF-3-like protein
VTHANGPDEAEPGQEDADALLQAAFAGLDPAGLQELLRRLAAAGPAGPAERPPPPSRRRPRRADAATYRVRIDLSETRPPVWRRLELSSSLFLDEVHDVIQAAFGWTDSHLHRFGSGSAYYGKETEYYLCPFEVEEGEPGIPEEQVRLDEVLQDPGETLFYGYDFGDDWQHVIRLEAVLPRSESARRARCTAGRRPGPPEDCGGVEGYELIVAATDPDNPGQAAAVAELRRLYGDEVSPEAFSITPFDVADVDAAIAALSLRDDQFEGPVPEPLRELAAALRTTPVRRQLRRLIGDALREPADVDAVTAARMVRPYAWLLDRVGPAGITLTGAGYLPPVHVAAAVTELALDAEWPGAGNRESQTRPVLDLRQSATRMGLLRKHRGRLLVTSRGQAVAADPLALWWHLAERMPVRSADPGERQAGLLLLVAVATRSADELNETVARFLRDIGWASSDGTPLSSGLAGRAARDTKAVLRRLGGVRQERGSYAPERPTPDGALFARAALQTWPRGS